MITLTNKTLRLGEIMRNVTKEFVEKQNLNNSNDVTDSIINCVASKFIRECKENGYNPFVLKSEKETIKGIKERIKTCIYCEIDIRRIREELIENMVIESTEWSSISAQIINWGIKHELQYMYKYLQRI